MKDALKFLIYAGLFCVPFITLYVENDLFFPYITGKNFAFRIIVEIVFAAWVLLACFDVKYRPKFSWMLACFSGLLVVMLFANILGEHPLQSFWNNFERMEGYVTLVHVFMFFVVLGTMMNTEKLWFRYFTATIVSTLLLCLNAFGQISGAVEHRYGGFRADGTLGNASYMAIYMLFMCFVALLMTTKTKSENVRRLLFLLVPLFAYMVLQTATRGTTIALIGGLIVTGFYILVFGKENKNVKKVAAGGLATLVLLVGLFITFKDTKFVQENPTLTRLSTITLQEGTTRFDIWTMAFQGVKERPFLGWGQSNYNYVFNKYYEPELHGQEAWFDRVHNIVIDWLIAGGVFGAFAYFSLLGSVFYYLIVVPLRNKSNETFTVAERGILVGMLSGYLVHNMFVFDNIVSYIFYGTILAYVHTRVSTAIPQLEKVRFDERMIRQVFAPVVAVALYFIVYWVNVPAIQAAGDIIDAFQLQDPSAMLAEFDQALARDSFGTQEVREQLTQRVQSVLQNKEVSEDVKNIAKIKVEEELLKQIEEKPGDARVEMFISSFYRMSGQPEKAIEHLRTARELSPNKQLIIYEQAFAAIQSGDNPGALQFFKEAFELAPQFDESRSFYAMAAIQNGQLGLVDELIQTDAQKNSFAMNDYAVQAAYQSKMYPLLIEMLEIRIQRKPDDVQERTSLAFVVNESGDTERAVAILTKAGEEIPSFKEQSKQFIESIYAQKLNVQKPQPGI